MKKTVYLAGPISGQTKGEANDWREYVIDALKPHGITGISPLRCESLIGKTYKPVHDNNLFGTERAISSKNYYDVNNCDFILAYLPEGKVSYGTLIEIGWSKPIGKPVILVAEDPLIRDHPVIRSCANWTLKNLDEAIEVLIGVLGDYTEE